MNGTMHTIGIIIVASVFTFGLRALPFLAFKKRTPDLILYLGSVLPGAIMSMLVVYCLRNTDPAGNGHAIPELVSVALTALLFKWKHNTLLSILAGTLLYMFLVQQVF